MRRAILTLTGLLLAGSALAQNIVTHPAFQVVQSTAPALDLNFLTTALDGRVTFSRASSRTCTNASGTIVTVATNAPCMDYDPAATYENRVLHSDLSGAVVGVLGSGGSLPSNWAVALPAGLTTTVAAVGTYLDVRISGTSTGTGYRLIPGVSSNTMTPSIPYVDSVKVAMIAGSSANLTALLLVNDTNAGFTSTPINLTSTPVAISTTANGTYTTGNPGIYLSMNSGVAIDITFRLNSWQWGNAPDAALFVPTVNSAVTQAVMKGFSVEAAGTNVVQNSNFADASTTHTNSTAGAPDGTATLGLLTALGNGYIYSNNTGGTVNQVITTSVFVKAGSVGWAHLSRVDFASSGADAWFNISSGVAGTVSTFGSLPPTSVTSSIKPWPGGFYRISMTLTWASNLGQSQVRIAPAASDAATSLNGQTLYYWGVQDEQGYAPTSYIPTTTATVTRAADVAYVNVAGLKGVNGNTGSLFAQMIYEAPNPQTGGTYARWFAFNDSNNPDAGTEWGVSMSLTYPTGGSAFIGNNATTSYAPAVSNAVAGSSFRHASAFNATKFSTATNATVSLDNIISQAVIPRTLTVLNFSQSQRYQAPASLWFQRFTNYPAYLGPNWATGKANGSIP